MNQHLRFDTAQIGPLRALLKKNSMLKASIADIVRFRVVVDANHVMQNLIYRARYPDRGPTAIEELVKATVVDLFAPRWLDVEMASAIRQAAATSRLPETELWARWMEFRPLLKWDDSLRQPGPESAQCCDPKDHPYVTLEKKIGADGILSKDFHIAQMGGHLLTLDFVLSARSYARAAVTNVSIRVLGTIVPAAAVMALIDLLRRMGRAFSSLPNPVKAFLLFGCAVAVFHPDSRRWITDRSAEACEAMKPAWRGFMEVVASLAATSTEAQSQAILHLQKATRTVRPKRNTAAMIPRARRRRRRAIQATASARAPATLTAGHT